MHRLSRTTLGIALVLALGGGGIAAQAASIDATTYASLLEHAQRKQYVRVMVNLDIDVPLDKAGDKKLQRELAAKLDALVAELGDEALATGRWNNGLGQIGLYVTPAGLTKLAQSAHARDFGRDDTASLRGFAYDIDGRLDRVEAEIERNGHADVEVALNLENFDYDIGPGGKALFRASAAQDAEAAAKLPALMNSLPARGVALSAPTRAAGQAESGPTRTLRIDKEGFYALKEHQGIRTFKLAGEMESVAPYLDPQALVVVREQGSAHVIVSLHRVSGYTPKLGGLPQRARQAQIDSIRATFAEIAGQFAGEDVALAQELPGIAAASFRMSAAALARLYKNPDARIQGVYLGKSDMTTQLAQSTSAAVMNMPLAWNSGYTGAGQSIAILDTGVEKSHGFLQGKVTYEACFGTRNQGNYLETLCLQPNTTWDSPLGLSDSASPTNCTFANDCNHGTMVAGVAAGKRNWNGLSGVAPDASIIAVKVVSRKTSDNTLSPEDADIAAAMQTIYTLGLTEITVNLSIGSGITYPGRCAIQGNMIHDAVQNLLSHNVPVVAAAGNGVKGKPGSRTGISYPACVDNVIKVAATDDYTGQYLETFSNVGIPGNYSGPMFLAPGCAITSSTLGGGTYTECGTSFAAPHVAGLYAILKAANPGITVANASAAIEKRGEELSVSTSPGPSTIVRVRVGYLSD